MESTKNFKKGYLTLLGLLATITILCILVLTVLKSYYKKPVVDKPTEQFLQEQNINNTNYQSLLSDVKSKLKSATQKEEEHAREFEGQ